MDEITPDLIARIATRLFNEPPQAEAAPEARVSPDGGAPDRIAPDTSPAPEGMASHFGSIPVSTSSWAPPVSAPSFASPPSMPTPPVESLPGMPTNASFPPVAPEGTNLPSFLSGRPAEPQTASGLSAFVQRVRRSHVDRETGLDLFGRSFREHIAPAAHSPTSRSRPFDVSAIRKDFPVLQQRIHGKPLAWLDNAATTQKPQSVIDAVSRFYEQDNSNIHRGAHTLAARATDAYEKAREKVQAFLGASSTKEIVFVRGTTEGINLITQTYGRKFLQPGDEVVLSILEHHANIVPWQTIAKEKGAVLRVIPVNDRGEIMLEEYQKILGPRTKVVALTQASNSLGTILPVAEMTQMAKRYGARVLIDGAQSVAHIPVNVQSLGADFFVFSGHKIFGPTGIGAVYIKEELHDILPPWQGGGNMIRNVTFEETTYADAPAKFLSLIHI